MDSEQVTLEFLLKPAPVPFIYKADLVRVIDGDTIDVTIDLGFSISMLARVRLKGVDTPEIFGPNAGPAGKQAQAFVTVWCSACTGLLLQSLKWEREKYGRVLGDFFRVRSDGTTDPISLAQALREAGLQKMNKAFA